MMDDFFDQLTSLCFSELSDTSKASDIEPIAGALGTLAIVTGRIIGFASRGDVHTVEVLQRLSRETIASEATRIVGLLATVPLVTGEGE